MLSEEFVKRTNQMNLILFHKHIVLTSVQSGKIKQKLFSGTNESRLLSLVLPLTHFNAYRKKKKIKIKTMNLKTSIS